ncbi:hypothetical protein BC628DRAFT_714612 [Trametes gibbosa]|nr:hypothetical protein BC628DRAFT_714612 [Trametes gibbosa]
MPIVTEVSPRDSHPTAEDPQHQQPFRHCVDIVTQDIQRGSPTPRFEVEKPRGRSLSPVHSRAVLQAPVPAFPSASTSAAATPAPTERYVAPPLTWRTAAQDAKAGIYYTKDEFPSSSFLPPPFSREPVRVQGGERVELLDEVDEYAVRVRVLRTGETGLIPAWNTEGALDRLTRMNTAFNEAATCPVEARALRRRFSESAAMGCSSEDDAHPSAAAAAAAPSADPSLAHTHARCIPFATRVRFGEYYANPSACDDSGSSSDSDDPDSPVSSPARGRLLHAQPGVYRAQSRTREEEGGITGSADSARASPGGRKSVVFPSTERPQVVFRYPSEELAGAFHEERSEDEESEGDEEWWWHGWEEPLEEDSADGEEEERRGRARDVKMAGVRDDAVSPWLAAIDEEDH